MLADWEERQTLFEHADGGVDISLAAVDQTSKPQRHDQTGGVRNPLAQPDCVFSHTGSRGEVS
jgi:hypothetical protein